jgi:hypothetical protein
MIYSPTIRKTALVAVLALTFASCKKNDNDSEPTKPSIRTAVNASTFTGATPYANSFVVNGTTTSTVDFTSGNQRNRMFQAINAYAGTASTGVISATVLNNMFSNTGSPFTGTYADLNGAPVQIKNVVASSLSAAEATTVRTKIEADLTAMATLSNSFGAVASQGVAGKLGTRMVDARGIEYGQIIQKSLIGALQYDYIGNVLLNTGLDADNYTLVSGKNYTQLEHNWDEAYGLLTLNPIYLAGSTDAVRGTTEFALGSYIWEYNKANYANIYLAFLKGRAAIVNNDKVELKKQATFIRTEIEVAIAKAAVGYLEKWGTRTTDADRAHDIGEGGGFVYSLRFLKLKGGDAAFSDGVINGLLPAAGNGIWDITPAKIATASAAIKTKFNIQ